MPAVDGLGGLKTRDFDHLQDLADQVEKAWAQGRTVDWATLLPPRGQSTRLAFLHELIKTDLGCRWRNRQGVLLDAYVEKFAEDLGALPSLPPALVFEEYRVRHLYGDRPPLEEYQQRFPGQFEEVQRLAREHDWRQDTTPPASSSQVTPFLSKSVIVPMTGGYELVELIGRGQFGEVWKAKAPGDIWKAIKIINRSIDQEEAQTEIKAMELIKNLEHPHLMRVDAFWVLQDRLIILMDLAKDGSLRQSLKRHKAAGQAGMPLAELLKFSRQAAAAVDYLHSKKVQHRDIKPENILVSEGNVRVADFGIAKGLGTRHMARGTFCGTPAYMPPEAWNEEIHIHGDQYSLAITYFELRTGRRLFKDDSLPALMQSHRYDAPKLDAVSADEQTVLRRALEKDPEKRFPSCLAFMDALEQVLARELPAAAAERPMQGPTPDQDTQKTLLPSGVSWKPDAAGRSTVEQPTQVIPEKPPWYIRIERVVAVAALTVLLLWFFFLRPGPPKPELPAEAPAGRFHVKPGTEAITWINPDTQKKYYKHVECLVDGVGPVEFVLVAGNADPPLPPYYIMVNKVWNGLFEKFAEAHPEAVRESQWRLGAQVIDDKDEERNLGIDNKRFPVYRVELAEAHQCARWLGGLLPSVDEWDKAAGRFETDQQQFPGWSVGEIAKNGGQEGAVAVNRRDKGPLEVGEAKGDQTRLGCNDMAGNGWEWTRNYEKYQPSDGKLWEIVANELPKLEGNDWIRLRGRKFIHPEPLKLEDLVKADKLPFSAKARADLSLQYELPHISFRVVTNVNLNRN